MKFEIWGGKKKRVEKRRKERQWGLMVLDEVSDGSGLTSGSGAVAVGGMDWK
jgi:hypothetical protein